MKGPILAFVAFIGLIIMLTMFAAMHAAIGFVVYVIWEYAARDIWTDLPPVTWWQFALLGGGMSLIRAVLFGPRLTIKNR